MTTTARGSPAAGQERMWIRMPPLLVKSSSRIVRTSLFPAAPGRRLVKSFGFGIRRNISHARGSSGHASRGEYLPESRELADCRNRQSSGRI
jgi:hypothetical protein